jgi:glycosyltransferase involved in cell wall biosynthesis
MGEEAVNYFKSLGLGWKVHSFCYCTQSTIGTSDIHHSTPQYIFVGSLVPRKNPMSIVRVFSQLKLGIVKFIGNGCLKDKIQKLIDRNNLQEQVKLLGTIPQHQIPQHLYDSDVLILPSIYDGWGAVVNEALQAGCFVICSNECGASSLLENNNKLGVVFKAGDDKGLADCMEYANSHLKEIRDNRDYRKEWAETHISGQAVAKYFVDCLNDYNYACNSHKNKAHKNV